MSGYDIIGDIHGCASPLANLLDRLGYAESERTGAYVHPNRQAIFVGDLVDRGGEQLDVLKIVKRMVDGGSAQLVMGHHEFNARAYATERPDGSGGFLRRHSPKNEQQHHAFLEQVTGSTRAAYLEWFTTMPLWLDLGGLRIVHACWHEPSLRIIQDALGSNRFATVDQIVAAAIKGTPLYDAVDVVLKGPEIDLTEHGLPRYSDKDGTTRNRARVAWWRASATTLRDLSVMDGPFTTEGGQPYPELPDTEVPASERSFSYGDDVPVFYGHYWRSGSPKQGQDWTAHTACVDFSAVSTGNLVAYRWDGETEIQPDHYFGIAG
ncbi:MAG: metallophosphoesterase [Mycobacterium sp.]